MVVTSFTGLAKVFLNIENVSNSVCTRRFCEAKMPDSYSNLFSRRFFLLKFQNSHFSFCSENFLSPKEFSFFVFFENFQIFSKIFIVSEGSLLHFFDILQQTGFSKKPKAPSNNFKNFSFLSLTYSADFRRSRLVFSSDHRPHTERFTFYRKYKTGKSTLEMSWSEHGKWPKTTNSKNLWH